MANNLSRERRRDLSEIISNPNRPIGRILESEWNRWGRFHREEATDISWRHRELRRRALISRAVESEQWN